MENKLKQPELGPGIVLAIIALMTVVALSLNFYLGWENDHPLEEAAEEIIEGVLGVNVDLTPFDHED